MRPLIFASLSVLYFALAIPSIRRASLPNPNDFGASKTVESAIPNLLNHAQQSIKKGQHDVASFPLNGASGKVEIFDDIPVPLLPVTPPLITPVLFTLIPVLITLHSFTLLKNAIYYLSNVQIDCDGVDFHCPWMPY